jgi:hypothetical protein
MPRHSARTPAMSAVALGVGLSSLIPACAPRNTPQQPPQSLQPAGLAELAGRAEAAAPGEVLRLHNPGDVAWATANAEIIDTRLIPNMPEVFDVPLDKVRRVREVLPPHPQAPQPAGALQEPLRGPIGGMLDESRTSPEMLFVGPTQTGWNPPDPTLAVGPNHIVATVNQAIGFYNKTTGQQTFFTDLGSPGNPGFFEAEGALNFVFDPKCFYDHYAGRFVVMAPEVYTDLQQAWICIAVSDDSDPNGVWYKYRTNAVIESSPGITHWWDYPGFGYDSQGYYVTSNLFGLSAGAGWGGVGFRVFDKTPMLTGQPVTFSTLRDGNAASVQIAQHFGSNIEPFFVSFASNTSLRVHAITNPITAPVLTQRTVTIPTFSNPVGAPTPGGTSLGTIDNRMFNAVWRNGTLHATHHVGVTNAGSSRTLARWYQMGTGTWPTSGVITLQQSGDVDPGPGVSSFFPAIYTNAANDVGMVIGTSSATQNVSVAITARDSDDPAGRMALPQVIRVGDVSGGGRWGDYYDMAVDPNNDSTFWVIGQYQRSNGWANWIASFSVGQFGQVQAFPDQAGSIMGGQSVTIDVLANDFSRNGSNLTISTFQPTSQRGGTITRSVGTGPGGRDRLTYTAPTGQQGSDSFTYTITDGTNNATAAATASTFDPALFRAGESIISTGAGLNAAYYDLTPGIELLPNYSTLTPFLNTSVTTLNFASTGGVFANSTRSDNVGAVYTGWFLAPASALYTFFTNSDDGSRLWIGNQLVVDNDGLHGMVEREGTIGLQPGYHPIRIEFFEGGGGAGLIVSRQQQGQAKGVIPGASLARGRACDSIDFNNDGSLFDPMDVDAFLSRFSEGPCIPASATCNDIDFNNDGSQFDPCDIDSFLLRFSEGPCTQCGL